MIQKIHMLRQFLDDQEATGAMKINSVLGCLSDKEWHRINDLCAETNLSEETMLIIVNFFRDYKFIEICMSGETVKLDKDYVDL